MALYYIIDLSTYVDEFIFKFGQSITGVLESIGMTVHLLFSLLI